MSAWVNGKLDLKCSLDVLKRAISNLMPQWADHIRIDPNGKLPMYRYNHERRTDVTVNLLLPGSGNPNYPEPPNRSSENDWGFSIGTDGKWECYFADFHKAEAFKLANNVRAEVAKMRMLAVAKLKGYQVAKNTSDKNKSVIEIIVDEERAKQMMQLA